MARQVIRQISKLLMVEANWWIQKCSLQSSFNAAARLKIFMIKDGGEGDLLTFLMLSMCQTL